MKPLFLLNGLLLAVSMASNAYGGLLVEKANYPGFTINHFSRYEFCRIYDDKVVIERKFGEESDMSFTTSETIKFNVSKGIQIALDKSAAENEQKSENMTCDAPTTVVTAYKDGAPFVLYSTGGCGNPLITRQGFATRMLRDLVDKYCEKTNEPMN